MSNKFATDMKAAREASGETLRSLAGRTGINFTYLSKIENGHEVPSEEAIQDIANCLGMETPHVENCFAAGKVPEMLREVFLAMEPSVAAAEMRNVYERHPLQYD